MTVELPVEISSILSGLVNQTKYDAREVFIKSLFLYKIAVDAEEAGQKLAILDADGEVDREIIGF